jgi:hypothetical protein
VVGCKSGPDGLNHATYIKTIFIYLFIVVGSSVSDSLAVSVEFSSLLSSAYEGKVNEECFPSKLIIVVNT